ncbi:MAG: alpha/beta hydrolase [Gammaproteobacteria bacterium]|nr:alpha/beta hydrolase [Gammaproteobacteria bacterium]
MTSTIRLTARSDEVDPERAVNEAMRRLVAQMAPLGLVPADLVAMTWEARHPAAFHPGRRPIHLAAREAISGFLPPVTLRPGGPGLSVVATLAAPRPPDPRPVWNGFDAAGLARAYSARGSIADTQPIFDRWRALGDAFVAAQHRPALDLVYGPGPNERLDLFYPASATPAAPLWIFVHGGYWQAMDKRLNVHLAAGMLGAGFAVAMPDYELAPSLPLAGIVDQVRRAALFLHANAAGFGLDADEVHVAGHSAGGHLCAMLASDPATAFLRSALPVSGLFDVEPHRLLPMGRLLGMPDSASARALSPIARRPNAGCRVAAAVGANEPAEFVRQSDALAQAWGCGPALHRVDRHHFDVVDDFADGGPLHELALRLAGR